MKHQLQCKSLEEKNKGKSYTKIWLLKLTLLGMILLKLKKKILIFEYKQKKNDNILVMYYILTYFQKNYPQVTSTYLKNFKSCWVIVLNNNSKKQFLRIFF